MSGASRNRQARVVPRRDITRRLLDEMAGYLFAGSKWVGVEEYRLRMVSRN